MTIWNPHSIVDPLESARKALETLSGITDTHRQFTETATLSILRAQAQQEELLKSTQNAIARISGFKSGIQSGISQTTEMASQVQKVLDNLYSIERINSTLSGMTSLSAMNTSWELPDFNLLPPVKIPAYYSDLSRAAEAITWSWVEPMRQLTSRLVEEGIDSPDLHTNGFLVMMQAIRDQADDIELDLAEPTLRLLTAYDIVLVLEREMKSFTRYSMEQCFGNEWWIHTPNKFQQKIELYRSQRLKFSEVDHEPIAYASLLELASLIADETLWQSVFVIQVPDYNQSWFAKTIADISSLRNDVAHPRPIGDPDFARLILSSKWLLEAIRPVQEVESSAVRNDDIPDPGEV